MEKGWSSKDIFVGILILIVIGAAIIGPIIESNSSGNNVGEKIVFPDTSNQGALSKSYANPYIPHWEKMPITYSFSEVDYCGELAKYRMLRAFDTIQNETNSFVRFMAVPTGGDIIINCYEGFNQFSSSPGTYTLGEGGPILYDDVITSGRIELSNSRNNATFNGGCTQYSDGEIHEIMHVFGVGHIDSRPSIMNSIGSLCVRLDKEISGCLESIYSSGKSGTSCVNIPDIRE